METLALTPFGGFSKQPWLYVDLPVFGKGEEGEEPLGVNRTIFRIVAVAGPRLEALLATVGVGFDIVSIASDA